MRIISVNMRPVTFALADDVLTLADSISNHKNVPRVLMKNGKRGVTALDTWRESDRCQTLVNNSSDLATTISQQFQPTNPSSQAYPSTEPSDSQVHISSESTHAELPAAEAFAANLIMKDIN